MAPDTLDKTSVACPAADRRARACPAPLTVEGNAIADDYYGIFTAGQVTG